MKRILSLFNALFIALIVCCLVSSCTKESLKIGISLDDMLVQPTKTAASYTSGAGLFTYSTYPSKVAKWQSDTKINGWPETTDRGEWVSTDEYNYVMEYLANHPNEGYDEVDLSTYFLQNVGSADHRYKTTPDQNGAIHETGMQMDYFEINGWHVNDYNAQGGPRIYIEDWPLTNLAYHDSFGNNTFDYYKFYYISMPDGTYNLYLCFDYATISQQGNVYPDGTYDDWVIKIVPGDGQEIVPPTEPGTTPEEPTVDPIDPKDEVETNLHIMERNDGTIESHLSIHVRAATDVEVFIPIPRQYYCDVDDMAIVNKHQDDYFVHGGPYKTTYTVGEYEVSLNVSFENNGIRIWTDGINDDVIDWCHKNFEDGLTFEVWNYFNDILTKEGLQEYLDQATIKFLDKIPDKYINSKPTEDDCTINPIE